MRATKMGEVERRGKAEEGASGVADTARGPPGPGGCPHPPQNVTSLLLWLQEKTKVFGTHRAGEEDSTLTARFQVSCNVSSENRGRRRKAGFSSSRAWTVHSREHSRTSWAWLQQSRPSAQILLMIPKTQENMLQGPSRTTARNSVHSPKTGGPHRERAQEAEMHSSESGS